MSENYSPSFHRRRMLRQFLCALMALLLAGGDALAWQPASAPQPVSGKRSKADTREARAQVQWEQLQTLGPEKDIEVETKSASEDPYPKTLRGRLERWTSDGLVLQLRNGKSMEIGKSQVLAVVLREKGRPGRGAAIGGAIGFGIGIPIGAAGAGTRDKTGSAQAEGGLVAGALFGVIGALIGRSASGTRRTTLYETR